ncbi:MAG: ferritin-like domain-containing protein [Parvicellaceae bacterium]
MDNSKLITELNNALSLELRAVLLYSHYAAYVQGIHRIHLSTHFNAEATESVGHANTVRSAIVKLGGIAVTERNSLEIKHSTNYVKMLEEAYETEKKASQVYGEILKTLEDFDDDELFDAIENIYFAELRSVEEVRMLLSS